MENWFSFIYNFICGGIAGTLAGLISHPFLRMKIQLQAYGVLHKYQYQNPKWLYTGLRYGALCYGTEKMFVFGVYNSLKSYGISDSAAGALAGFAASFVICPGEKLIIDAMNGVKTEFTFNHMFKGFYPTVCREMLGFSVHMGVYGYLMKTYNKENEFFKTLGCVSTAIVAGWSSIVPIDRLKTSMQTPGFSWKTYQFSKSFNGFGPALLRAVPFHCTSFSLMVYMMGKKDTIMSLELLN